MTLPPPVTRLKGSYLTSLEQTPKKVGCGGSGRREEVEPTGHALFSAPVSEFQPRLHFASFLHQADLLGPRLDFFPTPSTPFSALMRVLLLHTPVNFVLRTRVKFTRPYPFSMHSVFRAVCFMFREYILWLGTEITVLIFGDHTVPCRL